MAKAKRRKMGGVLRMRVDPLAKLHHTRRIDEAEYFAGRVMQETLEKASQPVLGQMRERVDTSVSFGSTPGNEQLRCVNALSRIRPLLGQDGYRLIEAVLANGMMPEAWAQKLGRQSRDDIRATGRAFKWALQTLVVHFGLATANAVAA